MGAASDPGFSNGFPSTPVDATKRHMDRPAFSGARLKSESPTGRSGPARAHTGARASGRFHINRDLLVVGAFSAFGLAVSAALSFAYSLPEAQSLLHLAFLS